MIIFAASSLYETLENMRKSMEEMAGKSITVHYGSSTQLLHQVKQGAPFDLFLSASPYDVETMTDEGLAETSSVRTFLTNDLVFITDDREVVNEPEVFLEDRGDGFLALGELNRVPLGVYTKRYFDENGIVVNDRITEVYGKDAFQVFRYVRMKQAKAGIVYGSDARRKEYPYKPLEGEVTIAYQLALRNGDDEAARLAAEWLLSDEAATIFRKGGFLPVGEGEK